MTYALQNVSLEQFRTDLSKFKVNISHYLKNGSIEGADREENASLMNILGLCSKIEEEFDKWDFERSKSGMCHLNGLCTPQLKSKLNKIQI